MSGSNQRFLEGTDFLKLETSYTNVNGIWIYPQEFMAVHNGTTLGLQELSIQGVALEEVAFSGLDVLLNVGKYVVDPTTNSIILIVDKVTPGFTSASDYITGMLLRYDLKTLEYLTGDSLYTMESYSADGTFLGSTQAASTSVLVSKMTLMDTVQDVNSSIGYQYHTFRRALQVQI